VAFAFQTSQTFRRCGAGLAGCLQDERLRRGGTPHLAEPAQGGGIAVGSPCRAAIRAEQKRLPPQRGRLQSPEGLCPCPTPVADRCIVEGRDRDGGEVPGVHEAGQLPGVPSVGCDPVTRLFGTAGGRDHPADRVFFRQLTIAPRPTRAGCIDKAQGVGLRLELPHQRVAVTLPGATSPEGNPLGSVIFGDGGHGARLFMYIHADVQRARLVYG